MKASTLDCWYCLSKLVVRKMLCPSHALLFLPFQLIVYCTLLLVHNGHSLVMLCFQDIYYVILSELDLQLVNAGHYSLPTMSTSKQSQSSNDTGTTEQQSRSLNRQVVLEEDEYTTALSHIIARDFFPSLVHLDAANNYLDALRTEDSQLINASVRQMQGLATPSTSRRRPLQTPSQTPWAGMPSDTPLRTPLTSNEPPAKKPRYDMNMNLDSFQARYTSEDNSSFTQILDDENRRRREKYGWAWEAQKRVEAQRDRMVEARERLLIEPGEGSATGVRGKIAIEAPTPVGLITQKGEEKDEETKAESEVEGKGGNDLALISSNTVSDTPQTEVDVMARKKDTRSAAVDGWKFKVCHSSHSIDMSS